MPSSIPFITEDQIISLLDYPSLIEQLDIAFQQDFTVPQRHHHTYHIHDDIPSTLLLMPAWTNQKYLGIKTVTVSPNNGQYNLPAIQGVYQLYDVKTGSPIAIMDARSLTAIRTAATSALASSFLSRKDSHRLLMIGTGALAPELIKAHASVRPLETVYLWGRNFTKAKKLAANINTPSYKVIPVENIEDYISQVDIISAATLSKTPLVLGQYLQAGQHLDLVGSYRPDMREADDESVLCATIFVDTFEGATKESGDLLIPLSTGIIEEKAIKASLIELCKRQHSGRETRQQITYFKSVGHALEDLAAATLIVERV